MDIKPRSRSRGSFETAAASAGSSSGEMPDLLASASTFTSIRTLRGGRLSGRCALWRIQRLQRRRAFFRAHHGAAGILRRCLQAALKQPFLGKVKEKKGMGFNHEQQSGYH